MQSLNLIQQLAIMALPLIFAVTVHEAAHAWVADKLGDDTARSLGRVTFNPIPHIDLLGTIALPLGLYALSALFGGAGFLFGYAKPVPVVARRLRRPQRDMAWVALAGPGANFAMALGWALLFAAAPAWIDLFAGGGRFLAYTAIFGVMINVFLMVLNLLPLLPLDGGRILAAVLPPDWARQYARTEPWGLFILLGLLFSGLLMPIILPIVQGLQHWLLA
ncbi:MAG: site-2 protease family protein [Pseudomonadota bacterium]